MDKMRETFEAQWGYTNEEQNCYFVPELNMYGSEFVNKAAEYKSTAWCYFQVGWRACQGSIVVDLPDTIANTGTLTSNAVLAYKRECHEAIEAAGLKVKP